MAPMDDGYRPDLGCDVYDAVARLKAWLHEHEITWEEASLRTGVSAAEIQRVIHQGTDHLQENMDIIHRLAHGLGIDTNWLLTGASAHAEQGQRTRRLFQWELVEQYVTRARFPRSMAREFIAWYMRRAEARMNTMALGSFEKGLPRTQQDVHRWFAEFSNKGR